MALPVFLEIIAYSKNTNTCTALSDDGKRFEFDPFVSCAIKMDDEQYECGFGNSVVGKKYLMTMYSVHSDYVVPHECGLTELIK